MIGPIKFGSYGTGLVRYLLGPGRAEEHVNPRVIAAESGIAVPVGVSLSADEVETLGFQIDLPHRLFGTRITREVTASDGTKIRQPAHIWHLPLSNPAGDRVLTDGEWAAIAEDLMHRMGFDLTRQHAACPWVAIRHGASANGNDHIHIAVSLVRDDGSRASVHQERVKVGEACAHYERQYGLSVVQGRLGGAAQPRSGWEVQAERQRSAERPAEAPARPQRSELETRVRAAAVASATEADFVRRLRMDGLMLLPFFAKGGTDVVTGYRVGLRAEHAHPIAGYRLAKDLSLPKLRRLWGSTPDAEREAVRVWKRERPSSHPASTGRYAGTEWHRAAAHVSRVVDRLASVPGSDDATWRAVASEAAGVLGNLATRLEADGYGPLTRAADSLSAATHRPNSEPAGRGRAGRELRGVAAVAAQALLPAGPAAWLGLVAEMARLARAISDAHGASAQAGAARALAAEAARELDSVHRHTGPPTPGSPGRVNRLGDGRLADQLPDGLQSVPAPGIER